MRIRTSVCLGSIIGCALWLAACTQTAKEEQPAASGGAPAAESPAKAPGAGGSPAAAVTPPPPPKPAPIVLAQGTAIKVRTTRALSTKTETSGETFEATLSEPLLADGKVVAPKGATAIGVVAESDPGGRVKGRAQLTVRLTHLKLDGREIEIQTDTATRLAPQTKKKDALTVGIASGVGAAIGAIAGGGKGAAIGAGAGAGAGTGAVLATHGAPAVIGAETLLTFQLRSPVEISR